MKIAITTQGSNLGALVSDKPGTASHLLVMDLTSKELKWFKGAEKIGPGRGLQFITMAVNEKCDAFLTGWLSPSGQGQLEALGITVISGMTGTAAHALEKYEQGHIANPETPPNQSADTSLLPDSKALGHACRHALTQIGSMLPVIAGIVLLIGLFSAFVPGPILSDFFRDSALPGIFKGALVGSFFTGNPANSYIIGKQLLDQGIGIGVVIALICAWVTVGIVQLPAESAALGKHFAVTRNILCFIISMGIALIMTSIMPG